MANNVHVAAASRNKALNAALETDADAGKLRIYDGTQPADASVAVSTQNLLAELVMNATAFGAASAGLATANAITAATAGHTSTATWFRLFKSDGTTVILDGSVGTSGCDLNLDSTSIVSGANVTVSSMTVSMSA